MSLVLLPSMLLRYITTRLLRVVEVWYHSKTYMGGVKLVRCVCCISSVLYRSSVIFVLFNVLAWLFWSVDVVAVPSFYLVARFLLLFVAAVL